MKQVHNNLSRYEIGLSGEARTHDIVLPKHERYQLRYTQI